ncbi:MAG: YchJ family protein [Steroidobacteraceae bacterium]
MPEVNAAPRCPCGSSIEYTACCGRWHAGEPAPTAEALMRSRYAAFVLQNEAYLLATWQPRKRPGSVLFEPGTKWLGLKVVAARVVGTDAAEVEFIARYRVGGGSAQRLHERSQFLTRLATIT